MSTFHIKSKKFLAITLMCTISFTSSVQAVPPLPKTQLERQTTFQRIMTFIKSPREQFMGTIGAVLVLLSMLSWGKSKNGIAVDGGASALQRASRGARDGFDELIDNRTLERRHEHEREQERFEQEQREWRERQERTRMAQEERADQRERFERGLSRVFEEAETDSGHVQQQRFDRQARARYLSRKERDARERLRELEDENLERRYQRDVQERDAFAAFFEAINAAGDLNIEIPPPIDRSLYVRKEGRTPSEILGGVRYRIIRPGEANNRPFNKERRVHSFKQKEHEERVRDAHERDEMPARLAEIEERRRAAREERDAYIRAIFGMAHAVQEDGVRGTGLPREELRAEFMQCAQAHILDREYQQDQQEQALVHRLLVNHLLTEQDDELEAAMAALSDESREKLLAHVRAKIEGLSADEIIAIKVDALYERTTNNPADAINDVDAYHAHVAQVRDRIAATGGDTLKARLDQEVEDGLSLVRVTNRVSGEASLFIKSALKRIPYFEAVFRSDFREAEQGEVNLDDVNPADITWLINHYALREQLEDDDCAAGKSELGRQTRVLYKLVKQQPLNPETIWRTAQAADALGCPGALAHIARFYVMTLTRDRVAELETMVQQAADGDVHDEITAEIQRQFFYEFGFWVGPRQELPEADLDANEGCNIYGIPYSVLEFSDDVGTSDVPSGGDSDLDEY